MLYEEFTKRTNIYPPMDLFEVIHEEYCNHDEWDKDQFCEAYKENKDFLAQHITTMYNEKKYKQENARVEKIRELEKDVEELTVENIRYSDRLEESEETLSEYVNEANRLRAENARLRKELEKAQGWEDIESKFNECAYEEDIITDDQAKDILNRYVLNIDICAVEILHETPIYQRDNRGNVRKSADKTQDVRPWADEDESNFSIAFNYCGTEYAYTFVDGQIEKIQPLHFVEFSLE